MPGSCTVHVIASRRTVPDPTVYGARRTRIASVRLRITVLGTRLTVPGALPYPVVLDALSRVPGLPSLVLGLPYLVVPDALSLASGLQWCQTHHHGSQACRPRCQLTVHVVDSRRTAPAWPWTTVQPAPCPVPAKAEAHLSCMHTDRMREPTGRMQVKIYCIHEHDAHMYIHIIHTYVHIYASSEVNAAYAIIASLRSAIIHKEKMSR